MYDVVSAFRNNHVSILCHFQNFCTSLWTENVRDKQLPWTVF